jgi:hypothetical protein
MVGAKSSNGTTWMEGHVVWSETQVTSTNVQPEALSPTVSYRVQKGEAGK